MTTQEPKQDMVTQSIHINAPREQVFALVSQPGWWLGDEDPPITEVVSQQGDATVLSHPQHGQYTFITRGMDVPERITFLWAAGEPDDRAQGGRTVVEFWLEEVDGVTEVTVEESGFSALEIDDDAHASAIAANTEGWVQELALLKKRSES